MAGTHRSEGNLGVGSCPICGTPEPRLVYPGQTTGTDGGSSAYRCTTTTRSRPAVYACPDCGHWLTDPRDWPDDLHAEYEQLEDEEYLALMDVKRRTFRRAADLVCRFIQPPAALLEVGSYAGLFLDEMDGRGFSVEGVEPSTWGVEISRGRGHHVTQGVADEVVGPAMADSWDAVVSWDVLEHVPDPQAFFDLLALAVKPDGIVVLSTLDRSNWFPRLLGKRWPWIIPMHLHYFDRDTVRRLGENSGLTYLDSAPHVHYTTPMYALKRLVRKAEQRAGTHSSSARLVIPIGFGDVRTFIFRKEPRL